MTTAETTAVEDRATEMTEETHRWVFDVRIIGPMAMVYSIVDEMGDAIPTDFRFESMDGEEDTYVCVVTVENRSVAHSLAASFCDQLDNLLSHDVYIAVESRLK